MGMEMRNCYRHGTCFPHFQPQLNIGISVDNGRSLSIKQKKEKELGEKQASVFPNMILDIYTASN